MLCSISAFAISAMGFLMTACLRLVRSAAVFRTIRTGSASKQPAESKILSLQEINGTGRCQGPSLHCRGPDFSSIVCSCGLVDGLIFVLTEQWRGGGHICKEHKLHETSANRSESSIKHLTAYFTQLLKGEHTEIALIQKLTRIRQAG